MRIWMALLLAAACVQQQPSGYYGPQPQYPQQPNYPQQQYPQPYGGTGYGGYGYGGGGYGGYAYGGQAAPQPRRFTFNGRVATAQDMQTLVQIERMYGYQAPPGDYWYDAKSGAAGRWNGPTLGFLPPNLNLGGPLPPNASGGGNGRVTGVFINGRELHPVDVQVLMQIYGQVYQGRWWVDAQGNAGQEGGPALVNLVMLARQRGSKAESYYRSDGRGNNAFVGGGCVSVNTSIGSGSSKQDVSYYSSGC